MSDQNPFDGEIELPKGGKGALAARGVLNAVSGAIPLAGGLLSAIAGAWGEREQERVNRIFEHWVKMLAAEMREKEQTIIEIMSRLDMHDEEIAKRVESPEYQSLLRKAFRDWAGGRERGQTGARAKPSRKRRGIQVNHRRRGETIFAVGEGLLRVSL
jgi:hypothetical protein